MKLLIKKYIIAVLFLAYLPAGLADELVLIVHQSNSIDVLSEADIRGIYLGKLKYFPGTRNKVLPINQVKSSAVRKTFYSTIVGMSASKLSRYWSKKIFSGRATPPKEVRDDFAMMKFVTSERHALGYIYKSSLNKSVKVVKVK